MQGAWTRLAFEKVSAFRWIFQHVLCIWAIYSPIQRRIYTTRAQGVWKTRKELRYIAVIVKRFGFIWKWGARNVFIKKDIMMTHATNEFPSKMDRSFQTSAKDIQHLLCTRWRKMFLLGVYSLWRYAMGVHGSGKENSPSAPAGTRTCNIRLRVRRFIHWTIPYTLSCGVLLLRTLFKEICIWCTAIFVCGSHAVHTAEIYNRFSTICARGRHVHVYSLRRSAMGAPHMSVCTLSAVDVP